MLTAPVPLYDREMAVQSYLFRYQQGNDLFSTTQATGMFDGGSNSVALEALNQVGLEAFTLGKDVVVPINHIMLLGNLHAQCQVRPENVIFLLDATPNLEEMHLKNIADFRLLGYRFAVSKISSLEQYANLLACADFAFLSQREQNVSLSEHLLPQLKQQYPHLQTVATHIHSEESLARAQRAPYTLFESRFFSVPATQGNTKVSPLKANSIRLLNIVQDENFDFKHVTSIVQQDPSLTVSLLRLVNTRHLKNRINTIAQAVAMLGQKEVRKWVTTAVSRSLGDDRPGEITRISLIRAKFAENLAPLFGLPHLAQELFLMGLFSVLDIILEVPMARALKMVSVSDSISNALLDQTGILFPVLHLLVNYEHANWQSVSRLMIVHDIKEEDLYHTYIESLTWYRDLIALQEEFNEAPAEIV